MKTVALAMLFAVAASPVLAQEAPADPAPAPKLDSRDPNAIRCRKIQVTGSLVKKEKICKTNAEWTKSSEQMRNDADDLVSRNRTGTNNPI